jgi:hypothetical protein
MTADGMAADASAVEEDETPAADKSLEDWADNLLGVKRMMQLTPLAQEEEGDTMKDDNNSAKQPANVSGQPLLPRPAAADDPSAAGSASTEATPPSTSGHQIGVLPPPSAGTPAAPVPQAQQQLSAPPGQHQPPAAAAAAPPAANQDVEMEDRTDSVIAAQAREYIRRKRAKDIKSRMANDYMMYKAIRGSNIRSTSAPNLLGGPVKMAPCYVRHAGGR